MANRIVPIASFVLLSYHDAGAQASLEVARGLQAVDFDRLQAVDGSDDNSANISQLSASITGPAARLNEMSINLDLMRQRLIGMQRMRNDVADIRTMVDIEVLAAAERDNGLETGWMVICTSMVMLMQLGFALVESGSVRAKSYRHVFLKNLLDFTLGMLLWYLVGYWIAFPHTWEGDLLDFEKFDLFYASSDSRAFYFQTVFASTAITIVSGAMAERTRMEAYLVFVALCGGMLYSVVVRWSWGGGWMSQLDPPYHDFAGSGVVHATGGVAAFVGASLVGPRAGRFDDSGTLEEMDKYRPHSLENVVMGTLILWFGWFGFNPGSTTSLLDGAADVASLAYLNTLICPAFGATVMLILGYCEHTFSRLPDHEKPPLFQLGNVCNGILGSLVGITGGCDSTPPQWTPVIGLLCGLFVYGWSHVMIKLKIDDPVDAVAVHGCCGIMGIIFPGFFDVDAGLITTGSIDLLGTQLTCAIAIIGYVGGTAFVYFYIVHAYGLLRMNMAIEVMGIDFAEFGEGMHRDVTDLEVKALAMYRRDMLERIQGDVWGITEEKAMEFAKSHRRMTVFFLTLAIFYNYFYYVFFEWRSWEFFSIVNLCIGFQAAAAAHAEFKCKPGEQRIRMFCLIVILISLGLSCVNFVIAPMEDLILAWVRMMTLSFGWSIWMHLRVHPVDWEAVCNAENVSKASASMSRTYFATLFGIGSANNVVDYVVGLITAGRAQHILESTFAFASVTSDLWVGLDELQNGPLGLGLFMITFSCIQMTGVCGKLVVAVAKRNLCFVRTVTAITWCAETPVMILVWISSTSDMKYVSILLSVGTLAQQMFMLTLWTLYDKYKKKQAIAEKTSPEEALLPKTQLKPWSAQGKKAPKVDPNMEIYATVRSGETISEEEAILVKQPRQDQEHGDMRPGKPPASTAPSVEAEREASGNKEISTPSGTPGGTPMVTPEVSPRQVVPKSPLLGSPRDDPPTFGAAPLTPR